MIRRAWLSLVAVLVGATLVALPAGRARAAEYTLASEARYTVSPDAGEVAVSVDLRFENTTPDPPGQFSVFEVVDLALQAGASGITAQDAKGTLEISLTTHDGFVAASVHPREPVRYSDAVEFTVTYTLPDGATPDLRVRPSALTFPAWSFGTSGSVTIVLPDDYEVRASGSELTPTREDGSIVLESGAISDPSTWLSQVTASRPSSFTTTSRTVPLSLGTVDLQVRAWADDAAWGTHVADLLEAGLPALEEAIGAPYPRSGPLVVVESVPDPSTGLGEPQPGNAEIAVAFSEPDFTALHQAAHVWFNPTLISDAWIREGFSSAAAERAAAALHVALPYDPGPRADELADAAFPLISWGAGETSAAQDAWAYAASWALADALTTSVGDAGMQLAWQRIAAGVPAYDPVGAAPSLPAQGAVPPVDSRRLLDQLQAVSGSASIEEAYAAAVFDEGTAALLPVRTRTRALYAGLLAKAGDWGAPDPVRADMVAWRFDDGAAAINEAAAWLVDRDALLASLDALRLGVPTRLRDRYQSAGGGADARTELDAEATVIAAYRVALDRVESGERSWLARIGLLGTGDLGGRLATAGSLFAQGELRGAADEIDAITAALDHAELDGIVRLTSAGFVLLLLVGLLVVVLRRRAGTGYTAAP